MSKSLANEYYICFRGQEQIPWNPADTDQMVTPECAYFGKVFEAMEKSLKVSGWTFYLTVDINELPSYGQNVVAVVLADEWCRIPIYFHKVRAVFKCYGTRPILGYNPLFELSYLNCLTLMQFIRTWFFRLPSMLNFWIQKLKSLQLGGSNTAPIYDIPLGYYKQLDLPIKDIQLRPYDVFFRGSVVHRMYLRWSLKQWLGTPKSISRKKMMSSIKRCKEKHPDLKLNLSTTSAFIPGFTVTSSTESRLYSEEMMDTKICLIPRGNSFETYRFFEALRYGCILVTEALPSRWFYDGSPAIQIKDWSELEEILEKLLKNKQILHEKHQESLNWWETKCSEVVVGAYIAEQLNSLISSSELHCIA